MNSGKSIFADFFIALLTTAAIAAICYPIAPAIGYQTVGLIFLISIAILSLFLGRSALIFNAILNFGVWNFFFIQPLYTFRVHSFHDLVALFANLVVALAASALINRIRKSQTTLLKSQEQLILLHRFLSNLNDAVSIRDVVRKAEEGIRDNFDAAIILYLKEKKDIRLSPKPFGDQKLNSLDMFLLARNFHDEVSSEKEEFLRKGNIIFCHLKEPRKSIGVIAICFNNETPEGDKMILLRSFITQIASALDREISIDEAKEKEISEESEKLFQTVLNSVSHELKTPIAIISAAASNLSDAKTSSEPEIRKQISEELEMASARLNHIVENILDMSRIDSGLLKLNLQVCDVSDLTGIAIKELRKGKERIKISMDENLPFLKADITLLKQALVNIIHNALIYTPPDSRVTVKAVKETNDSVSICVIDEGKGIPEEYLTRLFDKFYRVPGTGSGGTGLGLTIAKAIAELHGGSVSAANNPAGGLIVKMVLKTTDGQSD